MVALLCLWFGISFPLIFTGFYFGYRKQAYEHPVRTNQIPRQIPEQPWYLNLPLSSLVAGILPFGAIFVELFFILTVSHFTNQLLLIFVSVGYLGEPILLLVWFSVSRVCHPCYCVC